jgi:hypothetical protein
MLTHAIRNWPEVVTSEFWPFALLHASNILNYMPQKPIPGTSTVRPSPYELFT